MKISKHRLANQVQVLFVQDLDCPSVTVLAMFKVGSRVESKEKGGTAHLIEHMLFKGTKKRPSTKELGFEVENLGAGMNAYTSKESTAYYLKAPKSKAVEIVEILADLIKNPIFPEKELSKEKLVVLEEIKMYEDIPQQKVADIFNETLYPGNALGRDIAGTKASVAGLTRKDCLDFKSSKYGSDNLLIIVSGFFNKAALTRTITENFGDLTGKHPGEPDKFTEAKLGTKIVQEYRKLESSHIILGGYGYGLNTPYLKRLPYYLGRVVLNGGFASRLHLKIREELALVYYLNLGFQEYEETGFYAVSCGVDHDKVNIAINEILKEMKTVTAGNFNDAELERARNFLIGNFITYFETSESLANWYGNQLMFEHRTYTPQEIIKRIGKITRDEIVASWSPLLSRDNLLIATIGEKRSLKLADGIL
jgi:predicted Zn-dependent peptidase